MLSSYSRNIVAASAHTSQAPLSSHSGVSLHSAQMHTLPCGVWDPGYHGRVSKPCSSSSTNKRSSGAPRRLYQRCLIKKGVKDPPEPGKMAQYLQQLGMATFFFFTSKWETLSYFLNYSFWKVEKHKENEKSPFSTNSFLSLCKRSREPVIDDLLLFVTRMYFQNWNVSHNIFIQVCNKLNVSMLMQTHT